MHNKNTIHELIREFYPYAKKKMGFSKPCKVFLRENKTNAADPLGNTAYYDPDSMQIHIFTTGRHPKDVMRSLSHELVHHPQNCRGDLDDTGLAEDGYAQTNGHLRLMEKEAYLEGNICFRDWTDTRSQDIATHRGDGAGQTGSIPAQDEPQEEEWLGPAGNHSTGISKGNRQT